MGRPRHATIIVLIAVLAGTPVVSALCALWCDTPHAASVDDCHGRHRDGPQLRDDASPECAGPSQALVASRPLRLDDRSVVSLPVATVFTLAADAGNRPTPSLRRASWGPARPPSTSLALRI